MYETDDPEQFMGYLEDLMALGGGDEPEMSLSAIQVSGKRAQHCRRTPSQTLVFGAGVYVCVCAHLRVCVYVFVHVPYVCVHMQKCLCRT